jgi:hydrophobe/amphiphile efflux-3 (HAE3) family protein
MRTGSFLVKYRWWIVSLSVLTAAAFGLQVFRAEINPDLESYVYEKMPSRINTNMIEEIFGGDEMVLILFESEDVLQKETLSRIKKINREIKQLEGIDETLSLFDAKTIKGEDADGSGVGAMVVDPTVRRIPKTETKREALRAEIRENELVYRVLVSEDFRMTSIIATIEPGVVDDDIILAIEDVLAAHPGPEQTYIGGLPYIKACIAMEIAREFKLLMIIGLSIMLVMLYIFFREIRGVLLPFVVVVLSIVFAMGLMPLLGMEISIITLLLPIMLIAIANDYGIHMMARYQEYNTRGNNASISSMAKGVYTSLRSPILLTGITTIAGILCLLSHKMIPAKQLGIVAAAGIAFALVLSLIFIPSALSIIGKSKPVISDNPSKKRIIDSVLEYSGSLVARHPRKIIIGTALVSLISAIGIFRLHVDTNLENFFPHKHPVRMSSEIINETFGGSQNISILVEGDILDPEVMRKIDSYERELKTNPAVGNVMSIAGVVREISKALNDRDDPYYNRIPDSRNAIAQYMELYLMSGDPEDLERMVDFDFRRAQVMVRVNDGSNAALKSVLADIRSMTGDDDQSTRIGGYGLVAADLADLVVNGQVISLIIALAVVFLLLSLLFRSMTAGIIGTVPLATAIIILFGWMGYLGIQLDIATAILSSIMIGVGVDYTIHFLWRYRKERGRGLEPVKAVVRTLTTTGRGISFNALSVILGFCALPFSVFTPLQVFGFLVIVSIFTCLIGALVIVPALILIFRPAFLEPEVSGGLKIEWKIRTGWIRGRKPVPQHINTLNTIPAFIIPVFILITGFSGPSSQEAREIMEKARETSKLKGIEAVSTLRIYDSKGRERVRQTSMASREFNNGATEKRIIRFLSPAEVKGTGMLIYDHRDQNDDMWIYMPALRKTRRIVSSEKSKSFMGSEFSNADMSAPNPDDFTFELLRSEQAGGTDCWVIESVPVNEDVMDEMGFDRKLTWIGKKDYMVRKAEYFNEDDELFKSLKADNIKAVDPEGKKFMAMRMEMVNRLNGRRSVLIIDKIQYNPQVREEYFTLSFLEKI